MQIKTTVRYHLISVMMVIKKQKITSVGDVEKLEPWNSVGGNVKWTCVFPKFIILMPQFPNDVIWEVGLRK